MWGWGGPRRRDSHFGDPYTFPYEKGDKVIVAYHRASKKGGGDVDSVYFDNVGLDEKDIYLNPEIAYTGWEAQEVYVEFHFFDGDKGTPGGFYEDNSIITLGWRAAF